MQRNLHNIFLPALLLTFAVSLSAQTRYINEVFTGVDAQTDITYAQNISIITGLPALQDLQMDVYTPAGDTVTRRPVVVFFPTGNFLPAYLNGGPYGTRQDSVIIETSKRLVRRGYVTMVATYRSGWLPLAEDLETRTGTLLQAAYRGAQDAHALARFLRMSVAENDNPYGIDTSRIVYWGIGTGGYVTMAHAFLDDYNEILPNDQFYDADGNPLVTLEVNSNPQGTLPAEFQPGVPSNVPNHLGYNSNVAMSINAGGALGDPAWINGGGDEPLVLGYHALLDPFAPFYEGTVIVPTTDETVVSGVAGSNQILEIANAAGINDVLEPANALILPGIFDPLSSVVNQVNAAYKTVPTSLGGLIPTASFDTFALSQDNMYTWTRPTGSLGVLSTPYNWFDSTTLRFIVDMFPDSLNLDAESIIDNEGLTNPHWDDADAAKVYLDTILAHFIPRAYYGLNLEALLTSTEDLIASGDVGLQVSPNPAAEFVLVQTDVAYPMEEVSLVDMNGRVMTTFQSVNANQLRIDRGDLPPGLYVLRIRVEEGITSHKLMLH